MPEDMKKFKSESLLPKEHVYLECHPSRYHNCVDIWVDGDIIFHIDRFRVNRAMPEEIYTELHEQIWGEGKSAYSENYPNVKKLPVKPETISVLRVLSRMMS